MIKKTARDILIVFGLLALGVSTSRPAMKYLSDKRDGTKWWSDYPCLNGDLVSMSYLDFIPRFRKKRDYKFAVPSPYGERNTDLYLLGDSFAWHLEDSAFAGINKYFFMDSHSSRQIHLDTSKRNILIIEMAERFVRKYFNSSNVIFTITDTSDSKKNISLRSQGTARHGTIYSSIIPGLKINDLFNKNINQNLQFNLFNYNFIIPIFQAKAAVNYYLFNRASGDVIISKNKQFLFLRGTASLTDSGSSYIPVPQSEIDAIVGNLNTVYDHFRKIGFREVYISIIPNAATIEQPGGYNHLIPRIQDNKNLRMKTIDIYAEFANDTATNYCPGDTHWNNKGLKKWLALVNQKLTGSATANNQ